MKSSTRLELYKVDDTGEKKNSSRALNFDDWTTKIMIKNCSD